MDSLVEFLEKKDIAMHPETKTIFQQIQDECPNFLQHIQDADAYIQDAELRNINTQVAKKYKGHIRGCLWFHDPVTDDILLKHKAWQTAAMNEDIWFIISLVFPQLRPCLMTGMVTKTVAIMLANEEEFASMQAFFTKHHADIEQYRCLQLGDRRWLVFADNERKRHAYQPNGRRDYGGTREAEFLCRGTLVPIVQTVDWKQEPQRVTGAFPTLASTTSIPDFLLPYFWVNACTS